MTSEQKLRQQEERLERLIRDGATEAEIVAAYEEECKLAQKEERRAAYRQWNLAWKLRHSPVRHNRTPMQAYSEVSLVPLVDHRVNNQPPPSRRPHDHCSAGHPLTPENTYVAPHGVAMTCGAVPA